MRKWKLDDRISNVLSDEAKTAKTQPTKPFKFGNPWKHFNMASQIEQHDRICVPRFRGGGGGKINNFTLEQGKKTAFKAPKVNCRHLRRKKVLMRPSFRLYVLINRSGSSGKVPRRHSNVRHGRNKSLRSANLDVKTPRLQSSSKRKTTLETSTKAWKVSNKKKRITCLFEDLVHKTVIVGL